MSIPGLLQVVLYVVVLVLITRPIGQHMARVFTGERTFLDPLMGPAERAIYRVTAVDPAAEQSWVGYSFAMLVFSAAGAVVTYAIERLQNVLLVNPQGFDLVAPDLAFNTAVSFTTNTNWQFYSGESTMSYFTQMAALAFHNWVSAAAGIAIAIALTRGLARRSGRTIGNFWVDMVRGTLYVLLPMCFVYSLFLVWQGVPQNLNDYTSATTLEGVTQTIAQGPVASQEAIKMLGTNGGGFFNANSAHPFENPTPLSNFIQMLSIFAIGAGLTYTFGKLVGDTRQGWALFAAMLILFLAGVAVVLPVEQNGNPLLSQLGVDQALSNLQSGGNFEGKETRFGMSASALFVVITTDASCGAVNTMHDSLMAISGMIPMLNIQLGEVIFGGVGAGLYGMLTFAIIAVFIAGLMVGRTPEYLGKKIESFEMKMAMLAVLVLAGFCANGYWQQSASAGPRARRRPDARVAAAHAPHARGRRGQAARRHAQGRRRQHLPGSAGPRGDPPIVRQAASAAGGEEPGHVRGRGWRRDYDYCPGATNRDAHRQHRLHSADHPVAVVHGAVRQLCRSHGRGARQGSGRYAARNQEGNTRPSAA